jgi:ADP-ribosylation factor related protein 1
MLSIIFAFWEWLFRKEERKLIIIGVDNAGKSTLLEQIRKQYTGKGMDLDKIPPTIGLNSKFPYLNNCISV